MAPWRGRSMAVPLPACAPPPPSRHLLPSPPRPASQNLQASITTELIEIISGQCCLFLFVPLASTAPTPHPHPPTHTTPNTHTAQVPPPWRTELSTPAAPGAERGARASGMQTPPRQPPQLLFAALPPAARAEPCAAAGSALPVPSFPPAFSLFPCTSLTVSACLAPPRVPAPWPPWPPRRRRV